MAGISRSVSLVIAYLIKCNNRSFEEAYRLVKTKRKIVTLSISQMHPNDSFLAQLRTYAASLRAPLADLTIPNSSCEGPKELKPNRLQQPK
jgi:hypothetical protein